MLLLSLLLASTAIGQSVELGGSLGVGARGSESRLVSSESIRADGAYASVFLNDQFEVAIRGTWLHLGPRTGASIYYARCPEDRPACVSDVAFRVVDSSSAPRMFLSALGLYHFASPYAVRPFVGGGFGASRDRQNLQCVSVTVSCETAAPRQIPLGERKLTSYGPVVAAGIYASFAKHYGFRGGIDFFRPGGESLSLFEAFVAIGYHF